MNRLLLLTTFAVFGTSMSYAQCTTRPAYAYNGQVKIPYPSGNGTASVRQFCDPAAARFKQNLIGQSKALGIDVKWVEYYRVVDWVSAFHDTIYQTRSRGFQQANFKQFNIQGWHDMETLVYANGTGKFVGMISRKVPNTRNTSEFVLYGN